jgi:hypothetical protein
MTPLASTRTSSMRIIQAGLGKVKIYVPLQGRLTSLVSYSRSIRFQPCCHRMMAIASTSSRIELEVDQLKSNFNQQQNQRLIAAAAALLSGLALTSNTYQNQNKTDCCGIVGVVGTGKQDARLVLQS